MFKHLEHGMICIGCMRGDRYRRSEEAMKDKAKSIAGQLVSLAKDKEIGAASFDTASLKLILGDIYKSFGGPTSFASHLHWVIMELSRRKPIPAAVGHIMVNLMKLQHAVEMREDQVTAREMTDEQLKRETELAAMRLLVDQANDSERRKMLDSVLGQYGLTIREASADEIMEVVDESSTRIT